MTETRALMKSEATRQLSPAATLSRVNKVLYEDIKRGMFVTMFYMVLDAARRQLLCASAGHNPLVIYRAATKTFDLVNPNGLALGIDKGPLFDKTIKEQKLSLHDGDRFVLYTDGVVETMNETHAAYSPQKLQKRTAELAHKTSSEFLSLVVRDLEQHQAGAPQHDDITIVTGRVSVPATPTA
jgi:sigma-B regulation protein RsbU (phosphoserine phosphatase)